MPVEHRPPPGLETFVACAWIGTTTGASVLPDGCVDVVWSAEQVVVAGPATRPADVPAVEGDARLGVRFRVGLAGPALGVPARALRDEEVPLGELWG
ncbi:MAG: AraC family transcriptional regulator, partial [Solirubrobacterales bacterium]|nr:AraC family transcriptional regulator [Solirubrobacterales bacterium]